MRKYLTVEVVSSDPAIDACGESIFTRTRRMAGNEVRARLLAVRNLEQIYVEDYWVAGAYTVRLTVSYDWPSRKGPTISRLGPSIYKGRFGHRRCPRSGVRLYNNCLFRAKGQL